MMALRKMTTKLKTQKMLMTKLTSQKKPAAILEELGEVTNS